MKAHIRFSVLFPSRDSKENGRYSCCYFKVGEQLKFFRVGWLKILREILFNLYLHRCTFHNYSFLRFRLQCGAIHIVYSFGCSSFENPTPHRLHHHLYIITVQVEYGNSEIQQKSRCFHFHRDAPFASSALNHIWSFSVYGVACPSLSRFEWNFHFF